MGSTVELDLKQRNQTFRVKVKILFSLLLTLSELKRRLAIYTDCVCFQNSCKKTIRGWVNVYAFPESPTIFPVVSLKDFMARTNQLRHADAQSIFVTLTKPHKSVCAQTLAHWIKTLMRRAGVDTLVFSQHSHLVPRLLGMARPGPCLQNKFARQVNGQT